MEYPKFKVCCRCFTFNQAKYITNAMNGFTMQQTSFPFVCTIVDDASTDGEQEVIRKYVEDNFDFSEGAAAFNKETEYAHITYAQHNTNKNCYFAVLYLKENHYSQRKPKMGYLSEWRDICEYEALCEGDDYWIDPNKLQKQFDIMETDCEISLVHTGFYCVDEVGNKIIRPEYEKFIDMSRDGKMFLPLIKFGNYIMTLTVMVRTNLYKSPLYIGCTYKIDYCLFLTASAEGKIAYCNDKTSCYRNNPNSMVNTINKKIRDILQIIQVDFINYYFDGKINKKYIDRPFVTTLYCIRRLCSKKYSTFMPVLNKHPQYFIVFLMFYIFLLIRTFIKKWLKD